MRRTDVSDLRCTYCGGPLLLTLITETRDNRETEVPDAIECCDIRCGAVWETDGTLRLAACALAQLTPPSRPAPDTEED